MLCTTFFFFFFGPTFLHSFGFDILRRFGELGSAPATRCCTLRLVDGDARRGPEVDGGRRAAVEGTTLAVEARPLAGRAQAALAGRDDLRDELLAVHAHLHGGPVLRELLGEVQVASRRRGGVILAVLGEPEEDIAHHR